MQIAVVILIVVCCVLLVLFVLAQNSKGGATALGASSGGQMMGARKTTDLLEKLTWGFAIGLIVLCVAMNVLFLEGGTSNQEAADANFKVAQDKASTDGVDVDATPEVSADSAN